MQNTFKNTETFNSLVERKIGKDFMYHIAYNKPYDNFYHDLYNDLFYKNYVFKNNLSNGYYVEIGALDGVINSQSFIFEKQFKWDGIVVEPNPIWHENLKRYRKCKINKSAITNQKGTDIFECREMAAFSGLKSNTNDSRFSDIINEIEVETITLLDLFDKYNSPSVIDWVSIDTEGSEFDILAHYFENNTKYKINLINFESNDYSKAISFLDNQPYIRIKNPYLDFLKLSRKHGLLKFEPITGELHKSYLLDNTIVPEFDDLLDVNFEHFYIHIDFLKENLHLKKYIEYEKSLKL